VELRGAVRAVAEPTVVVTVIRVVMGQFLARAAAVLVALTMVSMVEVEAEAEAVDAVTPVTPVLLVTPGALRPQQPPTIV